MVLQLHIPAENQCLGRGLDPGRMESYRARSFCPELQKEAVITDLLYGGSAWELAASLLGRGRVKRPGRGQIALSFPDASPPGRLHPHLDGMLEGMPEVALPEPVPVSGRAGDVVLCHYQLAHAAGPNTSPHIRYAVYFRLEHVDHGRQKWECLIDVWREWPGMAGAAGQRTSTGNSTSSFPLRHQPSRFEQ